MKWLILGLLLFSGFGCVGVEIQSPISQFPGLTTPLTPRALDSPSANNEVDLRIMWTSFPLSSISIPSGTRGLLYGAQLDPFSFRLFPKLHPLDPDSLGTIEALCIVISPLMGNIPLYERTPVQARATLVLSGRPYSRNSRDALHISERPYPQGGNRFDVTGDLRPRDSFPFCLPVYIPANKISHLEPISYDLYVEVSHPSIVDPFLENNIAFVKTITLIRQPSPDLKRYKVSLKTRSPEGLINSDTFCTLFNNEILAAPPLALNILQAPRLLNFIYPKAENSAEYWENNGAFFRRIPHEWLGNNYIRSITGSFPENGEAEMIGHSGYRLSSQIDLWLEGGNAVYFARCEPLPQNLWTPANDPNSSSPPPLTVIPYCISVQAQEVDWEDDLMQPPCEKDSENPFKARPINDRKLNALGTSAQNIEINAEKPIRSKLINPRTSYEWYSFILP